MKRRDAIWWEDAKALEDAIDDTEGNVNNYGETKTLNEKPGDGRTRLAFPRRCGYNR